MPEEEHTDNLEERVTRLEKKVRFLEQALHQAEIRDKDQRQVHTPQEPDLEFEETEPPGKRYRRDEGSIPVGENWLNWLGIGLLLLGVGFLFKYSVDQGWLIPPVRSAFGLAVGGSLLGAGFVSGKNTVPRQILLGGGVATFYITGFATFQLYSFVSTSAVWIFMVGVTLLALYLAIQHDEIILSVLGTLGGLATPFMLYSGEGSLVMLILYFALILAGSGTIYLAKGWKSLLWAAVTGGWLVLMVGWANNIYSVADPLTGDRWTLQLGALYAALIFWIIPVIREVLAFRNPARWPDAHRVRSNTGESSDFIANTSVQALSVATPTLLLFYSFGLWTLSDEIRGIIALISALLVGYSYLPLRKEGLNRLSLVHGFTALILVTIALVLLLDGEVLLISLALEALCLRIIASKTADTVISLSSHFLFGLVVVWVADRLMITPGSDLPILNLDALTELFIIGIAGIMVPPYLTDKHKNLVSVYRLAAHLALLGWFMKELSILQNGQAFVSVAWGIYALLILFLGFRQESNRIRFAGMATIFLVVGKLFLVDLSQISTLLRILLFIGFGVVFLVVSYLLHKRWGGTK
ncbi:DUF2339 domain-containing protein [Halalkalibaculum sp. DA384]|uniref:DUF2339 domain-containing protein n=1 Tax=Halalkalibaculum sp. DA384 TaxID=3373606 RepID=UPI003754AB43